MTYREILCGIGKKVLVKPAHFPNPNLGVEMDEFKDGVPILLYENLAKAPTAYVADGQTAVEKMTPNLSGGTGITGSAQPEYYFGDVLV